MEKILRDLNCMIINERRDNGEDSLNILSQKVVNSGAALGIQLSADAESMILIDDKGQVIKGDLYTALLSIISVKLKEANQIVVPFTTTEVMEQIATKFNTGIVRTKTSQQEHMSKLMENSNADAKKNFILNYDVFAATAKIINYISKENTTLSALVESIPEFHTTKKNIDCPWDAKGKVMRALTEEKVENTMELFEGVKIHHDKGWVLVLPDADEPVCTVYSEGVSAEIAESLSEMYVDKIKGIIQ